MPMQERHARATEGRVQRSHSFLVWSMLGIVWNITHIAMEWRMGTGNFRRWIVLLIVWSGFLVATRICGGRPWMGWTLIAMGACGVYALPLRHFEWERHPISWFGILPRIATQEEAGPGWIVPYNLLIYVGLAIGIALLWSGARMMQAGASRPRQSLRLLLFAGILFFPGVIGGFLGRGRVTWSVAIEVTMLAIMLAVVWLDRRPQYMRMHPSPSGTDHALAGRHA